VAEVTAWLLGSGRTLRRAVKGRAMGHVRPTTLRRAICVALGNAGDPAGEPALIAALGDASPLVRAHAAWGLGRLGTPGARAARAAAEAVETDPAVRRELPG